MTATDAPENRRRARRAAPSPARPIRRVDPPVGTVPGETGRTSVGLIAALPASVRDFPGRLLGIDAGGSATRVVALDHGRITVLPSAPPMNALLTADMTEILRGVIGRAGAAAVGIGMPGIGRRRQATELATKLTEDTGCRVHVAGDVEVARLGAFLGGPGVVVVAGTGSAAAGSDGQRTARAGGHGFLLGDEGSAYWIGREAVRAALRWEDRMGGSAAIHRAVRRVTGISLADLVDGVCRDPTNRRRLTILAPAVTALAARDSEARRIVEDAARHLAALATAVERQLGALPVAGAGGVFRAPAIWDVFSRLTGASRPLAPPEVGAAILAGVAERRQRRRN